MSKLTLRRVPFVLALCLLTACSSTPPAPAATDPQVAYRQAKEQLDGGLFEDAIKSYEQLEARFPYGRYAQQAQLDIAYAYFRQGEAESALAACDRFIRLYPNHPNADYAYYLKGRVYENDRIDSWFSFLPQQPLSERDSTAINNAFETYRLLSTRFPNSRYAVDVQERMRNLVEALATHNLNTANYYLARRAPLAAANRAQEIITRFPQSKQVEDALVVMVRAYRDLQLTDLASDAERVLRQNYPNNRLVTGG
ncbi:MAG: outer membrane protein assembly factor BamD [Candidatus Dactylopiibacterium carminicum]|uniref:Outer membrane protein assembly factor BamD n=1 Tax=Candidatus Dactylopiibacterium carminicum TaxID=857335 RepID=A0A272EU79_9RHOO|nr:outer membrane protein assembly factor BamD [Candidatus Dactylopiibacterium carminicum]KAF7599722.1 outer membrane protein assembly factor BamD [Candidatus Dactylopiibacterium carminicum]PAS93658.1 MAG: outer membrane protein assembly factor BamD [Candidatus Dactylopiibacterium carminicum]PAS97526.1 MAG: outer membrane protein assembly factor BamD [Candidatus Dactylopiibacterium carminicum]PAS99724.1 MAG: hypothetical protein BSR46_06500 [Candidatus Dactylopiibacterium carminicum]